MAACCQRQIGFVCRMLREGRISMRIGIDLLWVRVGICGGTESYIRNLLDGFAEYDKQNEYVLFAAKDHVRSFAKYADKPHMRLQACRVESRNRIRRIFWENAFLDAAAARCRIDVMLIPVYSKPAAHVSGIPYISVIHDFQALHYPEYFSPAKRCFLNASWKRTVRTSARLVTISDAVRKDLALHFPSAAGNAVTIYNPVATSCCGLSAGFIERRYGIRRFQYVYCVSSMLPHKNLDTILRAVRDMPNICLVLSGVGRERSLVHKLYRYQIAERVVLTGYVPDAVRDCLYENCRLFLFPSVFEGFGMPPIEAMRRGKRVVTTACASLREVTQNRAVYVEHPFSVSEWKEKIQYALTLPEEKVPFEQYEPCEIVRQYKKLFTSLAVENGKRCWDVGDRNEQMRIYEKIYDIVSEQERSAGKKLGYEKRAFLCNVGAHPQIVDVSGYKNLTNPEYCQALYMAVYHRLPEREEYQKWSAFFGMDSPSFQKKLLKKLAASSAAGINRIRLIHDPYAGRYRGIKYWLFGACYGLTDKPTLRQIGKKLPQPLQKLARKVLL